MLLVLNKKYRNIKFGFINYDRSGRLQPIKTLINSAQNNQIDYVMMILAVITGNFGSF